MRDTGHTEQCLFEGRSPQWTGGCRCTSDGSTFVFQEEIDLYVLIRVIIDLTRCLTLLTTHGIRFFFGSTTFEILHVLGCISLGSSRLGCMPSLPDINLILHAP